MSDNSDPSRWTPTERAMFAIIPIFAIGWAVIVGASARGVNWTGFEWNFQRTALLGDSFGVVGALMATAAAAFTFLTLRRERAENARLRLREAERDRADRERDTALQQREAARDRADRKREAEATFFQLLELRNSILNRIRVPNRAQSLEPIQGQRALEVISNNLATTIMPVNSESRASYDRHWKMIEGELGHYLRFTYHIVRFAVSNFESDRDQYNYVRLLRAQLSNAETQLIAINSAFGAGNPKMKVYVEHFSLLHNLPTDTIDRLRLRSLFAEPAFDSSETQKILSAAPSQTA